MIYLFMAGAPSQIDLFDYKPKLAGLRRQGPARLGPQGQRLTDDDLRQKQFPVAPSHVQVRSSMARAAPG